ncbi:MAG: autotransporter-associated beta strand repeat-containing protein, partial [Planctomycetes bacterium]|nr:autotransporter-associated beta strand repeat-containing protein [Planctomycetota bacterium]
VTTGIVTNSATGTWTLTVGADNSSSTFRGKLTNSSNKPLALKKTGTGALTLYNTANDYQGDTTVNGGTLKLGASNVIPNGSGKGNVIVGASGLFDLNGLSEAIGGLSGAGTVDSLAAGTVTLTVGDNNQTTQFTGTIDDTSGTLALTKTGTGTLRLDGSNTYAGATTVSAGTLGAGHANALGTTASDTAIGAAGTLSFGATGIAEVIVVQGALSTFAVSSVSGQLTLDVSSSSTIPVNTQGGDLTLSGKVTGTGGLNKQGLENLILSSTANDYEGKTIINSGSTTSGIQLGASNVIPDGANAKDVLVNTGFLDLNGHNETIRGLDSTGSVTTGIVTNSAVGTWTLSVGAQDATSSFAGKITNTNGRPLALTKIGTGTLTIGNTNNDFQGDTTVNGGTLKLGAAEVIPHGATRGNVIVGATETLDLNGHSETINGLSGAGTVTNGVASAVTLTLGDNNQTSTFSGTITEVTSGPLSLTKIGTGSQRLDGANTYTGPTTINAGTLAINGSTVAASAVSVNNTGTLSGGLGAAAGSVGGTVTVAAGGRIAPGTTTTTGILETGNATFASTSKYDVQLNGTTVGSGYDQLDVTGSVDLGSATVLVVSLGFTAVADDTFIIVNNDSADAVTGTFSGLAEGTVFAADGQLVQISYKGGDGNDVVLKRLGSPSIPTSSSHDSDSQGNSQVNPLQRYTRPITVDMNTGGVIFHLDRGPDASGADGIMPVYRQTFNAHPIVSIAYTLGSTVPTQLEVALSIGGIANAGSVFYDTAGLSPGQTIRLVLQGCPAGTMKSSLT